MARKREVDEYGLNTRERRFADEYIGNGGNATAAYRAISPNAKETTCGTQGKEWKDKPHIRSYIAIKTKERLDASSLRADNILDELIAIGFGQKQTGYSEKQCRNIRNVIFDKIAEKLGMPK